MKKILFAAAALTGLLATTGCSDEHQYNLYGDGSVKFETSFSNDVKVASRGALEDELSESALLWISTANGNAKDGVVRKYNGLSSIPATGVKLAGGQYVAELWAGDSLSASFEKKYFKARAPFSVTSGTTSVELVGRIANVVATVEYESAVADVLTDCKMTIGHDRGSLTFDSETPNTGYFMMPSTDKNLTWTLTGKKVSDGTIYTRSGVIENAAPTTEYILKVKFTPTAEELGGGYLDIVIDKTEISVEDNIVIKLGPTIFGYGFDIAQPVFAPAHQVPRRSVYVCTTAALSEVKLTNETLTPVIGGPDINLIGAQPSVIAALQAGGINFVNTSNADGDQMKINFEPEFLNTLADGLYPFEIEATDANGKTTKATLTLNISDAKVVAQNIDSDSPAIWATSATLSANVASDDATNYGIEYRENGASDWTKAYPAGSRAKGDVFTVTLTGLKAATTYQFRPFCDGFTGTEQTFTTEAKAQIPNAGFESWQSGKTVLLYGAGESIFWDSGNHGSSTLNKNVTNPSTEFVHSGTYSAQLKSEYVAVKFAAGNAFVGEFIGIEKTSHGILGFGRPFTSRPSAMRIWVKYRPVAVDRANTSKVPDLPKGTMDEGIIYFALTDGSIMESNSGKSYPFIIRTAEEQFFDKNRSDVVAHGEKVFVGNTEGEGLVEVVIPFNYVKEAKAKYLILTAAASRGGDYFVGGTGSTMWIDDVEFIYD